MPAALPHAAAYRNPALGAVIYLALVAVLVGSAVVATRRGRSRRRLERFSDAGMPRTDDVWPLEAAKLRQLVFVKGTGTMLFANSKPDEQGRYFATRWFVFVLPLVPRGRYYVRKGRTADSAPGWSTTRYTVFGQSRMRLWEVLRTYALWWLVVPAVFVGPILVGAIRSQNSDDDNAYMLGMMLLSLSLLTAVLILFAVWRAKWRKVRDARWVKGPPDKAGGPVTAEANRADR